MDDLISRQAAIDAAIEAADDWDGGYSITRSALIENAIKELPSAQPGPQWIPCGERLPENDEPVLISHSHGVAKAWWNGRFWSSVSIKKYKTVIAWMPLPEPYEDTQ